MGPLFSNVSPQLKAIFQEQGPKSLTLRQGQVIMGEIKEILPNNVAVVQFGKHQMTAQIEIPITAGQPYLFEVLSTEEMPQLRVLTESNIILSMTAQIEQVLKNLQISPSNEQLQLIRELINNQIPFRQADLKLALELYKTDQTQVTKEQLIGMFKNQLPITETTLGAIKAIDTEQSLNSQLEALYQLLEGETVDSQTTQQLLKKLSVILNKESAQKINLSQNLERIEELNQLIRSEANEQMNFGSAFIHESANEQIAQSDFELNQTVDQITKQMGLSDRELYQLNRVLTQLEEQQMAVTDKTTEQLHALLKNETLSNKLMQQLPTQASQVLEEFIQEPNIQQLNELSQPLKELIERQFPTENQKELFHLLGEIKAAEPTVFPIKDQFLIHVKNFLLNAGLDFEHQFLENGQKLAEQQESLKQLLLQAITEQTSYTKEAEQIVNLLTGQQLTLLREDASFLHLSTVIPNVFGMKEDIEIEFYSRKDKDAKIDADYCRIAFYLELDQLKTTIIDMNVQNRMVYLTVFNDQDISEHVELYKPILKEGLEKFNYTLSTLTHKNMSEKREPFGLKRQQNQSTFQSSHLDVRI